MYRATAAPPPTPSTNHPSTLSDPSSAVDADFLSHLIHRLPPSLVAPPRLKASCTAAASALLPTIAYPGKDRADPSFLRGFLLACTTSGFFQLTGHPVPKELALSAEPEMVSMFNLLPEKKRACFPRNWPLGYVNGDDEESDATGEFIFLDEACLSYAELELSSLRELML
ncbi:hypothetical protein MLD38_011100 [Melastoma candidum]|uniref:Uncharacterized protein n=1 Tax=Melastoma candidum TaxID=119954 RepID=A0ACB9R5G4_9MYRT|nr:hypothetical protein MLD38_011100 [Melastoma candidum]